MDIQLITPLLKDLFFSARIFETMAWYLLSLMTPADKHTQSFASLISGKDDSLFSDLLAGNPVDTQRLLNRSSRRRIRKLLKTRKALVKGADWTIALIIDATLHKRSSPHINNVQKFNHGKGYVTGHQWTNIGIQIGVEFVPLAPIPFYTNAECKARGMEYKTEHEKVCHFLKTFSFKHLKGEIVPSEVVVLLDSGYDNKKIQETIVSRRWDFAVSLKSNRQVSSRPKNWSRIDKYFGDGRRPWTSIRLVFYRNKMKKWRKYHIKQREGYLKDVHLRVNLVCSQSRKGAKVKHLACSNLSVSSKTILLAYEIRWAIETFHREVKSYLGQEDAGVKKFNSLHNHVHYVYVAYNLMKEKFPTKGIKSAQGDLENEKQIKRRKRYLAKLSLISGKERIKIQLQSDIQRIEVMKAS